MAKSSHSADDSGYGARVRYANGECRYFTGDVGYNAEDFQKDLKYRFDVRKKITIFYHRDTPQTCRAIAVAMAAAAGFKNVREELGAIMQ